ncbi:MAG: glycosyltransferase [Bacteroidetes bacterium]|nr:glycosyltransferase [Bacteroidota bacterium]
MSVYNEERYVAAAIKSILNQTYPYFEFIIINDGSTDKSEDIIKSFNDERIVYKKIEKVNFSAALNYGLKIAKYDYVARMDADDVSVQDRFEKQIKYIVNNPEVNVLSSAYGLFKNESVSHLYHLPSQDKIIKEQLNVSSSVCHAGSLYLRNHILKYGGYNENLDCLEDIELWLRIRKDTVFHNLTSVLYLIRLKENSMSANEQKKPKEFFQKIYFKYFDGNYYSDINKSYADYAVLKFRFDSKEEFRKYVKQEKILFNPKVFLLYLWSYLPGNISTKDITQWWKWKMIELSTLFNKSKKKHNKLISSLSK